jgi:hypothetical protein
MRDVADSHGALLPLREKRFAHRGKARARGTARLRNQFGKQ